MSKKRSPKLYLFLSVLDKISVLLEDLNSYCLSCCQTLALGHFTKTAFTNKLQNGVTR